MKHNDVLIVGGGMVGLLAALAILRTTELSVTLLDEKAQLPAFNPHGYSNRVSAITLQSQRYLASLGVWQQLLTYRVSPFQHIHIHDEKGKDVLQFSAAAIHKDTLGFIVENDAITAALRACLKNESRFNLQQGVIVKTLHVDDKKASVLLNSGEQLTASLLIGADGAHSIVRKESAIAVDHHPYQVNAIVATLKTAKSHAGIARQFFLNTGPLAFLPLADPHLVSLVWSLPAALSDDYMQLTDEAFNTLLTTTSQQLLGSLELLDASRAAFPLIRQQAKSYISNRMALVGDAAHVVHPLAGQGVNLGIGDVMILQEVLYAACHHQSDVGAKSILRKYERAAKTQAMMMIKAIDCINHVFVDGHARYAMMREMALRLLQSFGYVKQQVMRFATGL